MRSRASAALSPTDVSALVARTFSALARPAVGVSGDLLAAAPAWFESRQSAVAAPIAPSDLRPSLGAEPSSDGRRDLLTFLRSEAERGAGTPLEIAVTGHSKGGALAQVVAVWLKDALDAADPRESWDPTRNARVECYAFAGPTPGDVGFARRIERTLGANHHLLRNTNDVVTSAWQADELRRIPRSMAAAAPCSSG
jgi:Lipase (class 3)